MNKYLSTERINYVLNQLGLSVDISALNSHFVFLKEETEIQLYNNKIIFLLSDQELDFKKIIYKEDIPILFPVLSNENNIYTLSGTNLIFNHDVLKSAFYLLSGYQELNPEYKGKFNRFPFELSIQYKLDITHKPIVNYYFKFIELGLQEYCKQNNLLFVTKKQTNPFAFFLTHDIDKIDMYSFYDLVYYIKVLFGIRKKDLKFSVKLQKAIEYLFHFVFTKKNPSWDFEFLRTIEKKYNLKSAFYFLPKDLKHQDAYYSFNENRLQLLFNQLKEEGCEIGIHGTNRSATSFENLYSNINELKKHARVNISGIRQHRLLFDINITPHLHEKAGLLYDTTLGFAEYEGFRNSYCLPFNLYNFKDERPFKHWEIPLNVMDATLFEYRKLDNMSAFNAIKNIVAEVIKFNGTFTLLWHNGYFDEIIHPGIKDFYIQVLEYIHKANAKSILSSDINTLQEHDK